MTEQEKKQIKTKLEVYCMRFGSNNEAAESLKNVSAGTISQMLSGKWELISDKMWRNVNSQVGSSKSWEIVETRAFKRMFELLNDARESANVHAVVGAAGCGKTAAISAFGKLHKQTYTLSCNEYWNKKIFLAELLRKMGRSSAGLTTHDMMCEVTRILKSSIQPVIVLDEADKLSDSVFYFFVTLYNQLEDHCGLIMCATPFLSRRVSKGVRLGKMGYEEIESRLCHNFIPLPNANEVDVAAICMANGLTESSLITQVLEDASQYAFDLRRAKRKIYALKKKQLA